MKKPALSSQLSAIRKNFVPPALWLSILILFFAGTSFGDVLKVVVNDTIQPVTAEYIGSP